MRRVANWPRERAVLGRSICPRQSGVAIVRVDGRFVGRVIRVGSAWQTWARPAEPGPMIFVGWSARRRDAVALI